MYEKFKDFWDKKWGDVKLIENNNFSLEVKENYKNKGGILLDLGCGPGRDSIYFAKNGFKVDSFNFSQTAINGLKKFIQDMELNNISPILGNTLDYGFNKDYYDVIYSCNSLHYFDENNVKLIINKLKSSLKKGGYIFIRVKSVNDVDYGKGEKIGNNFYKLGDDIKYYFNKIFFSELFFDFEIIKLDEIQDIHNKIYGGTTINGFIDLIAKKY